MSTQAISAHSTNEPSRQPYFLGGWANGNTLKIAATALATLGWVGWMCMQQSVAVSHGGEISSLNWTSGAVQAFNTNLIYSIAFPLLGLAVTRRSDPALPWYVTATQGERFSPEIAQRPKEKRMGELLPDALYLHPESSKPKALAFVAHYDPNGALNPRGVVHTYEELLKHYDVKYVEVTSFEEICYEIGLAASQGPIQALIIDAHGSPNAIAFSPFHGLSSNTTDIARCFEPLDPSARIVLFSCSTGQRRAGTKPIAEILAEKTKRTVIAPDVPLLAAGIHLFQALPLTVALLGHPSDSMCGIGLFCFLEPLSMNICQEFSGGSSPNDMPACISTRRALDAIAAKNVGQKMNSDVATYYAEKAAEMRHAGAILTILDSQSYTVSEDVLKHAIQAVVTQCRVEDFDALMALSRFNNPSNMVIFLRTISELAQDGCPDDRKNKAFAKFSHLIENAPISELEDTLWVAAQRGNLDCWKAIFTSTRWGNIANEAVYRALDAAASTRGQGLIVQALLALPRLQNRLTQWKINAMVKSAQEQRSWDGLHAILSSSQIEKISIDRLDYLVREASVNLPAGFACVEAIINSIRFADITDEAIDVFFSHATESFPLDAQARTRLNTLIKRCRPSLFDAVMPLVTLAGVLVASPAKIFRALKKGLTRNTIPSKEEVKA